MSPSIDSQELPKNLRSLIADAKAAVERWEDDADEPETDDEILNASKEWTVRLSQGEYEADLYWKCVAEDCEEAGNWDGAKAAYRKLLSLNPDSFTQAFAYSSLASLCSILGEHKQALVYHHAASASERNKISNILYRRYLVDEASQLLRMGRIRAARRLASRGLATIEIGNEDNLNLVLLKMIVAHCQLKQRESIKAGELLSEAWSILEALRATSEQWGTEIGCGVHSAYSRWWRLEAQRRQFAGQAEAEIEAWQNSLDHVRRGAVGWDRIGWDISIVRALELLADAYERNGRINECVEARTEAGKIRDRWHLPANDKSPIEPSTYLTRIWKLLSSRQ
jgi:tetratricopeptide (TPR) repeat protein